MKSREFDVVLYGATGFIGRLTAEYLAKHAPPNTRIALAGRSADKLSATRAKLGAGAAQWPLVIADAGDDASLDAMAKRGTVVITTVGPYARHGLPLVRACAAAGTHYVDLTGEPLFVRDAIERYHETAVRTGARIVTSCGFDSIPSDLSVYLTYRRSLADNTGELTDTTLVAAMFGGVSAGTIASGRGMLEDVVREPVELRALLGPHTLSPDPEREPEVGPEPDWKALRARRIDGSLRGWTTAFPMSPYNTKIVRRTNGLLGWVYGKNFRYQEVMSVGRSPVAPVIATAGVAAYAAALTAAQVFARGLGATLTRRAGTLLTSPLGQRILDLLLPRSGTGPSALLRDLGWFRTITVAHTTSGARYRTTFAAKGDPGYAATSVMLAESALTLALDAERLSEVTGIVTPAAVMGEPLADRLRAAGMTITVDRLPAARESVSR